jgi:ATP-binding cassette subfamily F protein 3
LALLTLTDAVFDYGRERILAGVNLAVHAATRYALVGPNGAGKTTLLGVLAGEITLQGGQLSLAGSTALRYLRQESVLALSDDPTRALRAAVRDRAYARELELQAELEELGRRLAGAPAAEQAELIERQGRLQSAFEHLGGYTLEPRLEATLTGVGLPPAIWDNPLASLSGGERRRAALAATLLGHSDLLLLDEPTNHLDLESCEWLESHLLERRGAMVIISHDRWFLDRVAQRTLHIERGRLVDYGGNYSFYRRAAGERRKQDEAAWQRQRDHIRQTEAFIRKNIEGQKTKQAQSRRKQLEKLDRLERPAAVEQLYRFTLRPVRESGGTVLQAEGLARRHGQRSLFSDLDLLVVRGERVGILGPNGCGKSTLLRILAGLETADGGRVVRGHNVDLGLYDQDLELVSDHNTVLGEMQAVDPAATLGELRGYLAAFGFGEEMIDRPVKSLSGGERGRLALLRLIKEGHNTLLLDEPTNHLDIRSRESLERALTDFPGTLVMVSHDRRFLDRLVQRLVIFPGPGEAGPGVRVFLGGYADYVRRREEERRTAATPAAQPAAAAASADATPADAGRKGLSKNERARRLAWIDEVERTIASLETEKEQAIAAMSAPDCDNARRLELADRCAAIETELGEAMTRWEEWSAELEEGA